MISYTQGFVLNADGDEDPLAGALAALEESFTVIEERGAAGSGTRRRTWLDTFDWLLYRDGLILEHEQTRRTSCLILTDQDGSPKAAQPVPGWQSRRPARPADLPPGELKDTIAPLVEPRAILPAARAVTTRTVFRLLNAEGKTVARLLVDRTAVGADAPAEELPLRLSVAEVRGYPGQARRAASRLASVPGASPAPASVLITALTALDRHPGDYTGKVDARITGGMPASVAVATLLLSLLDTLERNVDGVLRDIDTEFLHDLRVSVRRTRSALKLLGDVFPAELTGHYSDEFKWLGDMTTPVRDLDVYLLGFGDLAASLVAASPADLEPFRDFLARRRVSEFRRLSSVLRSARFRALTHDWRKALCETLDTWDSRPRTRSRSSSRNSRSSRSSRDSRSSRSTREQQLAAAIATDRTARAYRKITKRGGAITSQSAPESLHDLRKRCKELRYLLEFFAPLYRPEAYRKVVGDLKKLQDCLGEFQDSQVQREEIATLAEAMLDWPGPPAAALADRSKAPGRARTRTPAATFLAMGEISARLAVSQDEARADFGHRFAAFAGVAGQQRVRALLDRSGPSAAALDGAG